MVAQHNAAAPALEALQGAAACCCSSAGHTANAAALHLLC